MGRFAFVGLCLVWVFVGACSQKQQPQDRRQFRMIMEAKLTRLDREMKDLKGSLSDGDLRAPDVANLLTRQQALHDRIKASNGIGNKDWMDARDSMEAEYRDLEGRCRQLKAEGPQFPPDTTRTSP